VLIVSVAILVVPRLFARPRMTMGIAVGAAALVIAWGLTGEISASNGTNNFSQVLLANFPSPPNWLDKATGRKPSIFLGQNITDPQGIWLMEFWNRSLQYVWSLDATAPGPGTTPPGYLTPDIAPNGRLIGRTIEHGAPPGVNYIVADQDIKVAGKFLEQPSVKRVLTEDQFGFPIHKVVVEPTRWRLLQIDQPLRLESTPVGIYSDGWTGKFSAYNQFSTPGNKPGWIKVRVSRAAFNGPDKKPGRVTIRAGELIQGPDKEPALGKVRDTLHWVVHSGKTRDFYVRATPPTRVEVQVSPTFSPHEFGNSSDRRQLGAQVTYEFTSKPPPGT
jgi:hypothetical protein